MLDRIDDEPLRFWFRNRELIQEWAALAKPAREFSRELIVDVAAKLDGHILGTKVTDAPAAGYGGRSFYKPEWEGPNGLPLAPIGLGWSLTRMSLAGGETPLVGVWCGDDAPSLLVDTIRDGLEGVRMETGWARRSNWRPWPLYRYIEVPTGEFWENLTTWRENVITPMDHAWESFALPLDELLSRLDSPKPVTGQNLAPAPRSTITP